MAAQSARPARADEQSNTPNSTKKSHKRKREIDGSAVATSTPTPTKKQKKEKIGNSTPTHSENSKKAKRTEAAVESGLQEDATEEKSAVSPIGSKAKSSGKHNLLDDGENKSKNKKRRTSVAASKTIETPSSVKKTGEEPKEEPEDDKVAKASKSKKRRDDGDATESVNESAKITTSVKHTKEEPDEDEETKSMRSKHSGILSKFQKSLKAAETAKAKGEDANATTTETIGPEPVIAQGLEPLPQPEQAPDVFEKPTYSSLPAWLADPLKVPVEERKKFSELGIDSKMLNILEENGYKEAFAVQSAVIPLLLPGSERHKGDLCISAATGSGKTLSYVLPMVTSLDSLPAPRLRGLIVVPTRELVRQAREACELCAAGSGLRIASAVGNVAIKDEQNLLMRTEEVYSPETSQKRQEKLTSKDWIDFDVQDYISEVKDLSETLHGYVHKHEPNVDILICTPGRLVDHIRHTKGFTLQHLQWLVIDEADRLLNESFQEWVEVVMTSLDTRKTPDAFGYAGRFFADLGLPLRNPEPRKAVLSATMTRDITKLNSLRLTNPKLVVVGTEKAAAAEHEDDADVTGSDAQFTLPSTLKEFTVSVGDGSKKPLYLLRLLLEHIKVDAGDKAKRASSAESEGASSDESDSDDTSSDESSSDESDSDAESDSDTSSDDDTSSSGSDESDSESEGDSVELVPTSGPARNTVLIFTKSSESASRLSRLISLLHPSLANQVGTIIKSNKSSASRKTLTAYRRGKISVIVATDRASRGLDLQSLTHVVNYDVPTSITTYVHRVGRTARAGKDGSAWTLVAHREGRWFTYEIAKGSDGKIVRSTNVEKVHMKLDNVNDLKSKYTAALDALEAEVKFGGKKLESN